MDRKKLIIPAALTIGCLPWIILFFIFMIWTIRGFEPSREIGLIHVSGVITAGRGSSGPFSEPGAASERIVKQLEKARKDDDIKAVVIRINSPGGSPSGSEEVYNEINRLRKDHKKVYVSMGDVAASGGYYIASAADKIFADASTITGSIGVIYENAELSKLLNKIGVNLNVITTGKYKDMGNPARPMTPDERALIKSMIADTYNQFVSAVSKGRKMPEPKIRNLADGRVFTGREAKTLGLVDEVGGLHDAVRAAGRAVGVKGEPEVKEFEEGGLADVLFGTGGEESLLGHVVSDAMRFQIKKVLLDPGRSYQEFR